VSRKLAWKLVALAAVACLMLVQWRTPGQRPDFSDFKVYWLAGEKAGAHQTVYDVQGHYQYKYSPFVALLWAVPHSLPGTRYQWALLHYAACAAGYLALFWLCARLIQRERALWLWLLALLVFSIGLRDELKLGQANLWPLLLVLPAWFAGPRPPGATGLDLRGLAIGAAWGFAIQWKLYALVLGPLWLLRFRPTVWIGALLFTVASLLGALSLAHGWDFAWQENVRWLQSLTASSEVLLVSQFNVSALGIFGKWGAHLGLELGAWAYAPWAMLALVWGAVLFWAEREAARRDAPYLRFWSTSWAWAGIVVLNPLVWPYWLLFCLPLFLLYLDEAAARGLRAISPGVVLVSLLFAAANWLQNMRAVHEGLSFIAVVVLLFDAQRRARRRDVEQLQRVCEVPLSLTLTPRAR
jgi:hypothetical protein